MQASERHGFEGEGFSYLKSPVWWGGVITCTGILVSIKFPRSLARSEELTDNCSGYRGSCEFRCLCICASHPCHSFGCAQCLDRVSSDYAAC